ncbi:MAG TPA: protein kinase [Roseiflexaceae bacterium]|nr:protein kinase [Roseiflexaceae bacterium]
MSVPPQLIGARLGAYEIQELLGSGGMANVYRGFDTNLHRAIAIKVLSPTAAAEPGFVDRFRQEARLIANLRHPNIVQVYDFDQQDSWIYMVQELLAGPTLEAWIRDLDARGVRPSPAEIIQIITQLAGALDAAHAAGIIHRDVKPANALWNNQGRLVLTDFGIAKQLLSGTHQTQLGLIFGTPSYLSPEQAQSLPLTPASDIYSLGVVLYELIAGQVPFHSTTPMHVAIDHIQTPPPPLPPRPDLAPEVEAVVQRALAKDPAVRFGSAGELANALTRAWAATPALRQPPAGAGIHNQATRVWQPPPPPVSRASTPAPPAPVNAGPPTPQTAARPAPAPGPFQQSRAPLAGSRSRLAVLGTLLAILLLTGTILAARSSARTAVTEVPAATTIPLVAAATTAAAPAQPSPPSLNTPSDSTDGFASLHALIEARGAAGQAGTHRDELLAELNSAQRALAAGDARMAVRHFTAMQQTLLAGTHDGTIDAGLMVEAMKRIQSLATTRGLTLPLSVQFE